MKHTVFTFLGKAHTDPKTDGFRTAFYRFDDGRRMEAAFFERTTNPVFSLRQQASIFGPGHGFD